jgi:hypothetical protein
MPHPIGKNPPNLLQTAVRVAQTVAPRVAQALPAPTRQAIQDTFSRVARPLVQLGETIAAQARKPLPKGGIVEIDEPPYTDTRTLDEIKAARDGSAATALDWARYQENQSNPNYDNWCLDFCINAYNLRNNDLCPEMTNPAPYAGTAWGAFQALKDHGKILPASGTPDPTQPLEAGTLVFFGPTDDNENAGHVCIATGRMAPDGTPEVITSGFPPDNSGVHYSSVGNLEQQSGPYVGYTTPQQGFTQPAPEQAG